MMLLDRRARERTKVHCAAKFLLSPDTSPRNCIVGNVAAVGACVMLESAGEQLPQTFELSFDNFVTIWRCEVVWQTAGQAGVAWVNDAIRAI
jgi:hypothetical protein